MKMPSLPFVADSSCRKDFSRGFRRLAVILPVCLMGAGLTGCGPVGRQAGRTVLRSAGKGFRGTLDDVAKFISKGVRATKPSDDAVKAIARGGYIAARIHIQNMRRAQADARQASDDARSAIDRIPGHVPYEKARFLQLLFEKNESLRENLTHEVTRAGDDAIRDKTAQELTRAFEKIAREQAAIARLAETVG